MVGTGGRFVGVVFLPVMCATIIPTTVLLLSGPVNVLVSLTWNAFCLNELPNSIVCSLITRANSLLFF